MKAEEEREVSGRPLDEWGKVEERGGERATPPQRGFERGFGSNPVFVQILPSHSSNTWT